MTPLDVASPDTASREGKTVRLRSTGRHARPPVRRRHAAPPPRRPALRRIAVVTTRTLVLAGLAAAPLSAVLRHPVSASAGSPATRAAGPGAPAPATAAGVDPADLLTSDHAEAVVARASRGAGREPLPAGPAPAPCVRPNEGALSFPGG